MNTLWFLLLPIIILLLLIGMLIHQRKVTRLQQAAMRELDKEFKDLLRKIKPSEDDK